VGCVDNISFSGRFTNDRRANGTSRRCVRRANGNIYMQNQVHNIPLAHVTYIVDLFCLHGGRTAVKFMSYIYIKKDQLLISVDNIIKKKCDGRGHKKTLILG
jgi:hypothetical protein